MLSKAIKHFDFNPISLGPNREYRTMLGGVVGLSFTVFVLLFFVMKLIMVINKDAIYVNYYSAEETAPINRQNLRINLLLIVSRGGQEDAWITPENQF